MSQNPDTPENSNLITTKEVATILGLSDSWVRRLIKSGKLPAMKPGHDWLVNRKDVEVYESILKLREIGRRIRKEDKTKARQDAQEGEDW